MYLVQLFLNRQFLHVLDVLRTGRAQGNAGDLCRRSPTFYSHPIPPAVWEQNTTGQGNEGRQADII